MASPLQRRILRALAIAIKPLARALLASGISFRQFEEVAKSAFVEVAAQEYGIRGRPTNNSRIAVITGLGRKEVRKVLDKSDGKQIEDFALESPASIVLHNWNNDPEFLDSSGLPKVLDYGPSNSSFVSLIAKYAGDIPPGAMKTELKRVNAIEETPNGQLRVVAPYFVPPGFGDRLIIGLEEGAATLLGTLAYNCDPHGGAEPRFQRIASVDGIHSKFHKEIEQNAKTKLTEFGLDFCTYLDSFERKSRALDEKDLGESQIGIGLYFYNTGNSEQ